MQRVNEYRFFELGAALERLKDVKQETLLWDAMFPCWETQRTLRPLLVDPAVSLRVCRPAAEKLLAQIATILPTLGTDSDPNKPIGPSAHGISSALAELRTVLEAECPTLEIYAVSQKGAYSMSQLIEKAEVLIPESTRQRLDREAIQDIQQAGRCLAFELPTAAGFHLFRAVESVMRVLYDRVKDKLQKRKKPSNWGGYVDALKEAQVASRITDLLDSIRQNYRNPISHPDATLTNDDAIVLVPLGVMAIQKMVEAMPSDSPEEGKQDATLARILATSVPKPT
ncbi:MAG: hypothetical protein OXC95_18055 [Dehalococcoidia bacterium]|nr:hypothetical protein [Dehalococcoidia bacterium]